LQAAGVAACPKHFIGNETETERTSYTARIGERTLREVYLPPFEDALAAGAWTVMAAYNGYDDGTGAAPATEHRGLLTGLLKQELGFDGVVVSDWMAARSTAPTAHAGLDLVMPGPLGPWGDALVRAVRAGEVPEAAVDDKVQRLLRLAGRGGRPDGATAPSPPPPRHRAGRPCPPRHPPPPPPCCPPPAGCPRWTPPASAGSRSSAPTPWTRASRAAAVRTCHPSAWPPPPRRCAPRCPTAS